MTLSNLALLEEATGKTEEKLRDRVNSVKAKIQQMAEVL